MSHRLFLFLSWYISGNDSGGYPIIIINWILQPSTSVYTTAFFLVSYFSWLKKEILSLRDIVVLFLEFCFSGIMQKRERKKKAPTDPARRKYPCSNNHYNQHPLFSFWKWWWREFRLNHHYKYGGRNICRQCWFGFFG